MGSIEVGEPGVRDEGVPEAPVPVAGIVAVGMVSEEEDGEDEQEATRAMSGSASRYLFTWSTVRERREAATYQRYT